MPEAVIHMESRDVLHVTGEQAAELQRRFKLATDLTKLKPFILDIGQERSRWVNPAFIAYIDFRP